MTGLAATAGESLSARRERAHLGAAAVLHALRSRGVEAELIGSLRDGGFGPASDVDFLILRCPRQMKYALESLVEDMLPGLNFDVLYADELSQALLGAVAELCRCRPSSRLILRANSQSSETRRLCSRRS